MSPFSETLSVLCANATFLECLRYVVSTLKDRARLTAARRLALTWLGLSAGVSLGAAFLYSKLAKWWYLVNVPAPKGFTPGLQEGPFGDYFYRSGAGDEYKLVPCELVLRPGSTFKESDVKYKFVELPKDREESVLQAAVLPLPCLKPPRYLVEIGIPDDAGDGFVTAGMAMRVNDWLVTARHLFFSEGKVGFGAKVVYLRSGLVTTKVTLGECVDLLEPGMTQERVNGTFRDLVAYRLPQPAWAALGAKSLRVSDLSHCGEGPIEVIGRPHDQLLITRGAIVRDDATERGSGLISYTANTVQSFSGSPVLAKVGSNTKVVGLHVGAGVGVNHGVSMPGLRRLFNKINFGSPEGASIWRQLLHGPSLSNSFFTESRETARRQAEIEEAEEIERRMEADAEAERADHDWYYSQDYLGKSERKRWTDAEWEEWQDRAIEYEHDRRMNDTQTNEDDAEERHARRFTPSAARWVDMSDTDSNESRARAQQLESPDVETIVETAMKYHADLLAAVKELSPPMCVHGLLRREFAKINLGKAWTTRCLNYLCTRGLVAIHKIDNVDWIEPLSLEDCGGDQGQRIRDVLQAAAPAALPPVKEEDAAQTDSSPSPEPAPPPLEAVCATAPATAAPPGLQPARKRGNRSKGSTPQVSVTNQSVNRWGAPPVFHTLEPAPRPIRDGRRFWANKVEAARPPLAALYLGEDIRSAMDSWMLEGNWRSLLRLRGVGAATLLQLDSLGLYRHYMDVGGVEFQSGGEVLYDARGVPFARKAGKCEAARGKSRGIKQLSPEFLEALDGIPWRGQSLSSHVRGFVAPPTGPAAVRASLKAQCALQTPGNWEQFLQDPEIDTKVDSFCDKYPTCLPPTFYDVQTLIRTYLYDMDGSKSAGWSSRYMPGPKNVWANTRELTDYLVQVRLALRIAEGDNIHYLCAEDMVRLGLRDPEEAFVKDEAHGESKVKSARWRLIWVSSMIDSLCQDILHRKQNKADISAYTAGDLTAQAVGLGHDDNGIAHLGAAIDAMSKGLPLKGSDVIGWDFSVCRDAIYFDAERRVSRFPDFVRIGEDTPTTMPLTYPLDQHIKMSAALLYAEAAVNSCHAIVVGDEIWVFENYGITASGIPSTSAQNSPIRSFTLAMAGAVDQMAAGDDELHTGDVDVAVLEAIGQRIKPGSETSSERHGPVEFTCQYFRKVDGVWAATFENFPKMVAHMDLRRGPDSEPAEDMLAGMRFALRHTPDAEAAFMAICRAMDWSLPQAQDISWD